RWLFDQAVCTLYAFCGVLFGLSSLASLTVLSTVCCLKVCYPAYGRCCALSAPRTTLEQSHLGYVPAQQLRRWLKRWEERESYGPEPYGTACCITWEPSSTEATLYILALFVFCYLLPCLLMLLSYALILWTVWASRRALRQH
ncbi:OPN5 protein, partial [Illadopsis cleaveri]|nr:OPN5 protein [Illadopsis cleaveri]